MPRSKAYETTEWKARSEGLSSRTHRYRSSIDIGAERAVQVVDDESAAIYAFIVDKYISTNGDPNFRSLEQLISMTRPATYSHIATAWFM